MTTPPQFDDTDVAPTNDVAATRPYDDLNVSSDAFWEKDVEERDLTFKQLREQRPISWQPPIETTLHPQQDDPGFWAVQAMPTSSKSVRTPTYSCRATASCSTCFRRFFCRWRCRFWPWTTRSTTKCAGWSARRLPCPQIKRIEDDIASRARRIVATARDKAAAGEPIYFVSDISRHLPIEMFGDMFGVPDELRPTVAHLADEIVAWADPVLLAGRDGAQVQVEATTQIHQIAAQLIAERREAAGRGPVDQSGAGRGRW